MARVLLGLFGIVSEKDKDDGQSISSNCEYICRFQTCAHAQEWVIFQIL